MLVTVAESGSLSAAARRLGVPKSTVGRAIARIEEDLGVTLVRRVARGPALTEQGRALASLSAPHVAALRDVTAALGREAAEAYGLLRVTAPSDVGAHLIAPLLPAFLGRYPRVRIEVEHTLRVVDLVREGFDLAIRLATVAGAARAGAAARRTGGTAGSSAARPSWPAFPRLRSAR